MYLRMRLLPIFRVKKGSFSSVSHFDEAKNSEVASSKEGHHKPAMGPLAWISLVWVATFFVIALLSLVLLTVYFVKAFFPSDSS